MVDSVCIYSNLSSFLKVQGTIFSYFHRIEHLIESKEFLLDPLADCKISIFGVGHKFKLESDEFLTSWLTEWDSIGSTFKQGVLLWKSMTFSWSGKCSEWVGVENPFLGFLITCDASVDLWLGILAFFSFIKHWTTSACPNLTAKCIGVSPLTLQSIVEALASKRIWVT